MFFYYEDEKPKVGRTDHKKEIIKIINIVSLILCIFFVINDMLSIQLFSKR